MNSTYCVICRSGSWKIETVDPYLELLHNVFGSYIIDTTSCYFDEKEAVTKKVLKTLAKCEEEVIISLFGLFGNEKNTPEQIKVKNGMADDEWQEFIARTFRKLRHPSRSKLLRGIGCEPNNYCSYVLGSEYQNDIHSKLIKEIKEVINDNKKDTVFLNRVLQKNEIELEAIHLKYLNPDININDIDLTVRTYTCLVRADIHTVNEIIDMSDDDLMKLRNFGRKSLDEISYKLHEIKKSIGQYNSVCVVKNGEKTVYKFFDDDLEKISNEIYLEIVGDRATIIPATNLTTKGESIEFSTPSIEGTVTRRNKPDSQGKHPWKAEVNEDDTAVNSTTISNWYKQVYEPVYSAG